MPHTYDQWNDTLGKRDSRKVGNNTYAHRRDDGTIGIRLHNTDVVIYHPDGTLELQTGGWFTPTTRDRINTFGPTDFTVSAHKGSWRVHRIGDWTAPVCAFFDGIRFRDGDVINLPSAPRDDIAADAQLKRDVTRYLKGLTLERWSTLVADAVERGTTGDCWFCSMFPDTGDNDHLRSHIDESYYIVTLALNALREVGYRDPSFIVHTSTRSTHGLLTVKRAIRRYLMSRLSIGPTTGRKPTAAHSDGFTVR